MAVRKKASVPVVDDEEYDDDEGYEIDEDEEPEYEDEEEGEDSGPESWQDFVPDLKEAMAAGYLDRFLKEIAYHARKRYMELHPDEFPDENGHKAPRVVDPRVLGVDGLQLQAVAYDVGLSGKMPPASFRANNHAYSKEALTGRKVAIRKAYTNKARASTYLPPGTILTVRAAYDKRFEAVVDMDLVPDDAVMNRRDVEGMVYVMRYEYHPYLFEGGK